MTLLEAPQTVRSLFSRGNEGAKALLYKGLQTMKWNDIDLEENIKVLQPYLKTDSKLASLSLIVD